LTARRGRAARGAEARAHPSAGRNDEPRCTRARGSRARLRAPRRAPLHRQRDRGVEEARGYAGARWKVTAKSSLGNSDASRVRAGAGSLKCLHAHVAFALARPGYELGQRIVEELEPLWPASCCTE